MGDAVTYLKKLKTKNADALVKEIMEYDDWKTGKNTEGGASIWLDFKCGYIMIFDHEDNWKETLANVGHECIHLCNAVLHRAGLKLTRDSEEAFTYLHTKAFLDISHKIY